MNRIYTAIGIACFMCLIAATNAFADNMFGVPATFRMEETMCRVYILVVGGVAKAASVVGIIILSLGWFVFKLNRGAALVTATAIVVSLSSFQITQYITGHTEFADRCDDKLATFQTSPGNYDDGEGYNDPDPSPTNSCSLFDAGASGWSFLNGSSTASGGTLTMSGTTPTTAYSTPTTINEAFTYNMNFSVTGNGSTVVYGIRRTDSGVNFYQGGTVVTSGTPTNVSMTYPGSLPPGVYEVYFLNLGTNNNAQITGLDVTQSSTGSGGACP